MELPQYAVEDIRALNLPSKPEQYFPEGWQGTVVDILCSKICLPLSKLQIVLYAKWVPQSILAPFACDCAEHILHIYEEGHPNDKRPRQAIETARKYLAGQATKAELNRAIKAIQEARRSLACWTDDGAAVAAAEWAANTAMDDTLDNASYSTYFTVLEARYAVRATNANASEHRWQVERLVNLLVEAS